MFTVIRIILGALFIVSGLEKIISPAENFQYVIEGYAFLSPELARAVSLVFPWMELFTGLFITLGLWLQPALMGMLLISTTFIIVVGQAIIRRLPLENCGCFGNLIHLPLQGVIMLDSAIFALTLFLLLNINKSSEFGLDALYERFRVLGKIEKRKENMMKHLFLGALLLLGSFYSPVTYASVDSMDIGSIGGKEAPDFTLRTLMHDKQSLKALIKGKKSIVFFWATWCPYCRKEMAAISRNMPDIQKKDIQFVFVNVGEAPNKVRSFLEKNKIEADVFLDENSEVAAQYRVVGLPTFVYVNKNGVINQIENGLLDNYEEVVSKE